MLRYLTIVSFAILVLSESAAAQPSDALAGLWKATQDNGPAVKGAVIVARNPSGWMASAGGRSAAISAHGNDLSFTLPGNQGRFRGELRGGAVDGFWIQPATRNLGVEHASPIHLASVGQDRWRGEIVPLPDRLAVYLSIARNSDGKLAAFLRNPELNLGRGRALAVAFDGNAVSLSFEKTGQVVMKGKLDRRNQSLALEYPGQSLSLAFVRSAAGAGFLPRDDQNYSYREPVAGSDGWSVSTLREEGIDEAAISALVKRILVTPPGPDTPYIDSLLIARHDRLVLDEYFNGFDRNAPHSLRSASKTVTAMLFGAAVTHGTKLSPDTRALPLFPEYGATRHPDPRKDRITAGNLMSMTSGLACNDDDDGSPGNEDTMQSQTAEDDWYRYILDLPIVVAPGTKAAYCSGGVNLAGGMIARAAHRPLLDQFDEYLARPLGIDLYYANLTPAGDMYGGGGLTLRPRDALKFGQLYLDGGVWNGHRLVGKDWIERSTSTHSQMHADSTYGYNWWLFKVRVGDRVYDEWEAGGNGGQFIDVIPALDLVVGATGGNYGRFDLWYRFQTDVLPKVILSAVAAKAPD
jgi:CubicO group peptidase (beta-lactamase class C family)